jgi:hypothetical protein
VKPTGDEVRDTANAITAMRRAVGSPLILIAVIPSDSVMPSREGLAELVRLAPIVERGCDMQYAVLEGGSFADKIVRAALAAVLAVTRIPVTIGPSVEDAITRACGETLDVKAVVAEARERGFMAG